MTVLSSPLPASQNQDAGGVPDEPTVLGLGATTWVKITLVAGLMGLLFWPNLWRLWSKTNPFSGEANWQHAVLIPIVGIYYLYANRQQLLSAGVRPGWTGALIAVGGILFYAYGIYPGQNDYFKDLGMVVTLFGVVALLAGWRVMKVAWFPIAYLVFGIPWPGLFYSRVSGPLQQWAAEAAVFVLKLSGIDAVRQGNQIVMDFVRAGSPVHRVLNVAEACSGLKSLMTFLSLAAAIAFLSVRPLWQKLIIVLSAIPIAIFCNVMRVSGQGLLDAHVSQKWSEGFAHQFVGLVMLIPAFFLILLVGWVLDRMFVDEVSEADRPPVRNVIARKTPAGSAVIRRASDLRTGETT